MHTLIVVSHPNPASLTHALASQVAEGVRTSGEHSAELADLTAEGFDPRFAMSDITAHLRETPISDDVRAEQVRIDRADALVLVYPVYWWSMPALMKGWIDRVFCNGWAYEENADLTTVRKLMHLKVHLVAVAGADHGTYARRGYGDAMQTQIEEGIFGYCGAPVVSSDLLSLADPAEVPGHLERARGLGQGMFAEAPVVGDWR